jgi:hypothetical protein
VRTAASINIVFTLMKVAMADGLLSAGFVAPWRVPWSISSTALLTLYPGSVLGQSGLGLYAGHGGLFVYGNDRLHVR